VEEPILVLDAADMEKFLTEEVPGEGRVRDPWRMGVGAVVALAALAGVAIVGPVSARPAQASEKAPTAVLQWEHRTRQMGDRIAQLEEANQKLYTAIEAAHLKLAEVEVLRATMEETAFTPRDPVRTETADARLQ